MSKDTADKLRALLQPVVVETFNTRIEAEMLRALLETHSISSFIRADDCGGVAPHLAFAQGAALFVAQKDLSRARELLLIMKNAPPEPSEPDDEV